MTTGDARTPGAALLILEDRSVEVAFRRGEHTQSLQIWRLIQARVRVYVVRGAPQHDDPQTVVEQHRHLLAAWQSGDPRPSGTAIEAHISECLNP